MAAAHHVEELAVLLARADHDLARSRDDLQLVDVVRLGAVAEARHAEAGHGERAADGHAQVVGEHPRHEAARGGGPDQLAPGQAGIDRGGLARLVDLMDGAHRGHVEQHARVGGGLAALGVALAAGHDRDAALAAEADHLGHLLGGSAAGHGAGQAVHHAAEVGAEVRTDLLVEQDPVPQGLFHVPEGFGY